MFYCPLRPELRPLGLRGRRACIPLQRKKKTRKHKTKRKKVGHEKMIGHAVQNISEIYPFF